MLVSKRLEGFVFGGYGRGTVSISASDTSGGALGELGAI